jgi:hypothetical protein
MTLSWSTKGKHAKALFYSNFNDIDIYVEDTAIGVKKLYKEIYTRVFAGTCRIETVFPLGDKPTVIQECVKNQNEGGRPRIYIVDGDLDLLTDSNPKELKRFYVLKRYSIENYLVDETAIIEILDEEDIEKCADDIKLDLDFSQWEKENEELLFELFVIYAIAKKIRPDLPTISYKVENLVSSNQGLVDREKITKRIELVIKELLYYLSEDELKEQKQIIHDRVNLSGRKKLHFVSGKDFLFPLIFVKMKLINKFRPDKKVIQQRLAKKCDITELKDCLNSLFV